MVEIRPHHRSRLGDEKGSELIEFGLVLPIMLLVFAAIIDFGFLFQRYEVLTNAAREGARIAVLPGYSATDVQNRVDSYLSSSGLTATHPLADVAYSSQVVTVGGPTIQIVTVTVEYPSSFVFLSPMAALIGAGSHGTVTLRAVSVMRIEGAP